VLQWLLTMRRRATLAVMTGLMVGSLRALWPWQDEDRGLLGPAGDVGPVLGFVALGLTIVGALLVVEARGLRAGGPPEGDVDPVLDDEVRSRA
jgi:putative membrane protein